MVHKSTESFDDAYAVWTDTYKRLKEGSKSCLVSMDYSFVELEYQNEVQSILKSIIKMSSLVRTFKDLLVMVSRPEYKSLEVIKQLSDIHLRVFEYDGTTMLAAVKPQLFLFNIQNDFSQGFPAAVLQEST